MEEFGGRFCVATIGWVGGADRVIEEIRGKLDGSRIDSTRAFIDLCEDAAYNFTKRYGERMKTSEEDLDFALVCAAPDGIFQINADGTSEQNYDYGCFGSSDVYGEYILKQLYQPGSSLENGAKWAAYAIMQAMNLDPAVGGAIHVAFINQRKVRVLKQEEVLRIQQQISSQSPEFQRDLFGVVDRLVQFRRELNQHISKKYGFMLFNQQESAIWSLAHQVITEDDFTNRILALGMLVDEMTITQKSKSSETRGNGSIDYLEEWLLGLGKPKQKVHDLVKELRNIRMLRNKKVPVHPDDAGFITVVLQWGLSFPPDWARLHLVAVQKYLDFVKELTEIVTK